jgi:hypothetical protein
VSTSILDLEGRPHLGVRAARKRIPAAERITRNIEVSPTGCHLWTGRLMNTGYAQFTVVQVGYKSVALLGHRVAYELAYGRIPDGMVIDHLCRVRRCVNPDHLEPVAQRENTMRSPIAMGALNAAKTHCAQGHPYDAANTYVYQMKKRSTTVRICRTCRAIWRKRSKGVAA